MLAVVSRARLGDVLNPIAGASGLNCGLFGGGVFQKACWCIQWPGLCSPADTAAALALANPDVAYPTMPQPAHVPAVSVGLSPMPAPLGPSPESPTDYTAYNAAVDAAIAAGDVATKQATAGYFSDVQAGLEAMAQTAAPNAWLPWALAGGAVLVFVMLAKR